MASTGLTRSAIRGLIGEPRCRRPGLGRATGAAGDAGRPSPLVRLNADRAVVLPSRSRSICLAAAVVGPGGEVLDLVRVDRPAGHFSVDEIAADLAELATVVRARPSTSDALIGVGVAVVGVVRRIDGFVSMAPNLGWRDVPLGERLARALDTHVPVSVANDADLGALAEFAGALPSAEHVLFIHGEVGAGGGLIVDGRPLTGVAGYGGEVGHIPVNPNGVACRCGSVGC